MKKSIRQRLDKNVAMSDVIEFDDVNVSSIGSAQSGNVSGPMMGGEPLKLILLSAMFSLSVLVKTFLYIYSL